MSIVIGVMLVASTTQNVPPAASQSAASPAQTSRVAATPSASSGAATPVVAVAKAETSYALPANTEIFMTLNQELSSKRVEEGEMFALTISHDVMLGKFVVVPKGTPAFGEVTWKTGRAVFGKSGKMEVQLRYVDLNGRRIPISGKFRQEGEGSTVAAVGAVIVAAPLMVITGKSARIPEGRELKAYTLEALPVSLPEGTVIEAEPVKAITPVQAVPASAPATSSTSS